MKHKLTVCCGTTCYLTEGNRTDKLEQLLHEKYGDIIEVVPSGCLGQCSKVNRPDHSHPPYAKLDGEIISNATTENIMKKLDNLL